MTTLAVLVAPTAPPVAYFQIYEYCAYFFFGPAVLLILIMIIAVKLGFDMP